MNDKSQNQEVVEAETETETEVEIYVPPEKHPQAVALVAKDSGSLILAIERMAMNPKADMEKMEKLMQMHRENQDREAELYFNQSMALCQGEMTPVVKTAYNKHTQSTYARLDDICRAINPIYSKHGFSVTSRTAASKIEGHFLTITDIRHVGGHKETIHLDLPIDDKGKDGNANKTGIHGVASTISYARRYSICMGFNVATGDDTDGNQGQAEQATVETITAAQLQELTDLIAESETTAEAVCEQAGISQLSELRAEHFGPAKNHIEGFTGEAS